MKTFNGLPLYNIEIGDNDETGIEAVSLVKHPAVEVDFLTFDEDAKPLSFSVDEDEHILTAVAMRCDYPIYRRSGDYEYYVIFSKDVIKRLVQKYAKNNLFNSVNINHNSFSFVKDVYMIESFIIDREKGVDYKGFEGISDGSWIVSYYIADEKLWDIIKNSDSLNGVSIEGAFHLIEDSVTNAEEKLSQQKEQTFDEWLEELINIAEME